MYATHSANIGTLIMDNHAAVTSYFVFNMYVHLYSHADFLLPTGNIVVLFSKNVHITNIQY